MPMDVKTHVALGLDRPTPMEVNGRSNHDIGPSLNHAGDTPYHPCPEAFPDESIAPGTTIKHSRLDPVAHLPGHDCATCSCTRPPTTTRSDPPR